MSVNIYKKETDTLQKVAGVAKLDTWTGTQAEFDALDKSILSDNCYINITDDLAFGGEEYSTSEIVVGKWIDGKPIYRLSGISTTSTITSKINKTIVDSMIRSDVHMHTPSYIYGAMSYIQTSSNRSCYEINTDGVLMLSTGIPFNKIVFTFEYTKTTD